MWVILLCKEIFGFFQLFFILIKFYNPKPAITVVDLAQDKKTNAMTVPRAYSLTTCPSPCAFHAMEFSNTKIATMFVSFATWNIALSAKPWIPAQNASTDFILRTSTKEASVSRRSQCLLS